MYFSHYLSVNFGAKILNIQAPEHLCLDEYQFLTLQKGAITITYEDTGEKVMLQKGDVLMIPPKCAHICAPYSPNILLGVKIEAGFLSVLLDANQYFFCDSTKDSKKHYQKLHQLICRICAAFYTEDNQYLMLSFIYEFADTLKKNFVETHYSAKINASELQLQERITAIEHYLQSYYHQPISLDLLADKMFLTPQYLSKFIKKHLGSTFSHYLTDIRLNHAHMELVNTDNSITTIALNNGFPNIAAFNKAFRDRYGAAPSSYRTQYKEERQSVTPIQEVLPIPEAPPGTPQLLEISTSLISPQPYHKPWCDTINIGSLADAMKVSFHDNFLECKEQHLSVKYVRFSGIFSEEIIYLDELTNEFNFSTLDEIFDFFYEADVIPFVELSYKPRRTHLAMEVSGYWDQLFPSEKSDDYYYRLLSAILHHCIQRFGLSYVSKWRFELWLKHHTNLVYPDNFDSYFDKYQQYYTLIKNLLPDCSVGGPGFNMCGNIQTFSKFLNTAVKKNISFDFISVYGFSYETQNFMAMDLTDSHGILSSNINHIPDTFLRYEALVKTTAYKNIPIYITELGSSVALENYIVDSVFQATFLCHNMLQFINRCSNAAYLSFWDNNSDRSIPNSIYYPAASLIEEDGIPKPALYGYSFLSRLGKNLISQGDNYILTCNSSNRFQLLLYHYTHYNDSFCLNPWETIPMEHTYELFRQEEPQSIHFTCKHFPPGRYKAVQYSLNRNYGSALDKNLRTLENSSTTATELIYATLNLKEDESRYFKQTAIPRQDIYYITSDDVLTLDVTLESHEIVFYEFSRIL